MKPKPTLGGKIALIIFVLLVIMLFSGIFNSNPTRKGTHRCTICGSPNIYYDSGSYAYCKKHFNDMVNYAP